MIPGVIRDLPEQRQRRTVTTVLAAGLLGLVGVAVLSRWGQQQLPVADVPVTGQETRHEVAVALDRPLAIRPVVGRLLPVSAAEWEDLRQQVQPPRKGKVNSSYGLHLLRLHGLNERLQSQDLPSGEAIVKLFTDEEVGRAYFGEPALVRLGSGVRYPTGGLEGVSRDSSLELHRDQTLAAFAELGLPLSHPLRVGGEAVALREVLNDSIANFHLGQKELAWTAIAYALYRADQPTWTNRYGEAYSFDDLANKLISRPLDRESCGGTHLLYALTIMARVDSTRPILRQPGRSRVWDYLRQAVSVAARTQQPEGSWHPCWNYELLPNHAPVGLSSRDDNINRIIMTGHLAEWMLYLPEQVQPDPQVLRRAGQWLKHELLRASTELKEQEFCTYTHASCVVRQLALVEEGVRLARPATDD
jgi:hypothetical protein